VVRIDTQLRGLWQGLRTADLHVQADARAAAEAIVSRLQEKGIRRRGWRSNEIAAKIATTAENPDPKPYMGTLITLQISECRAVAIAIGCPKKCDQVSVR